MLPGAAKRIKTTCHQLSPTCAGADVDVVFQRVGERGSAQGGGERVRQVVQRRGKAL